MPSADAPDDRYLDRPYRLAGRLIDPIAGTATFLDQRLPLKRKHLEVLACLAGAGTAMVSRETFIDQVWRGNALIGESGLTHAMHAIRRALQDTSAHEPLIRTIPRRGYQLTAAAEDVGETLPEAFAPGMPIAGKPGWHLARRLGGNAVGELWLAEDSASGEQHVFRFCRNEQHLQALRRETTVLRYLRQVLAGRRDTAMVLDWQLDEPPYHLEMDYACGGSLAEWAAAQGGIGQVAWGERLRLMSEVAGALAAVHAAEVVHRHIGPGSVLVDGDGDGDDGIHARLGEFGLSEVSDRSRLQALQITSAGLTLTGEETGDALYLSPERLAGEPATAAGDVYAFGVLLLQVVTGNLQRAPAIGWQQSVDSQPLRELILSCTAASADARPQAATVAEWLHALATGDAGRTDLGTSGRSAAPASEPAPGDASAGAPAPAETAAPADPAVRTRIGPYHLIDRLGEGGMGVVYLAEQHAPVQRKVALKVVRTGLMNADMRARFEAERQALALMHHANVASVFFAGSTESGQPYFAMEYVQGQDITAHCDQLRLDFRARIDLFLQACEGVLHAHQKGLIHRDLKPGNILVSRARDQPAVVKIIDFGVAKSMSGLLAVNPAHTRIGSFVGTPVYSSPEQVSGPVANVDTRADIYSLGVVLYELLSGVTPYSPDELNRKTPVELARLLGSEHAPSPTVRYASLGQEEGQRIAERRSLSVEAMKAELDADLSWIIGKCLEVDPDDRYPSVLELEKDLRRWLDDKPVLARPASRVYKLRKFVRRHRLGVAAGALAAAALLTTTGAAVYGYLRAEQAREEAEMAAEFQVKQIQGLDPEKMGLGLRQALQTAVRKQATDRGGGGAALAEREGNLQAAIEGVNFTDLAIEQIDRNTFRPALEAIRNEYGGNPLLQARLWESIADNQYRIGLYDAALQPQRLAWKQRERLLGSDHELTLLSLAKLNGLYIALGKSNEGLAGMRTALDRARNSLGPRHPETLRIQTRLAYSLLETGHYGEDAKLFLDAYRVQETLQGPEHKDTLRSLDGLAEALVYGGKPEEALKYAEISLRRNREKYGTGSLESTAAMNTLSHVYWEMKEYGKTESIQKELLVVYRKKLGENHPFTLQAMSVLAIVLEKKNRAKEAENELRRVVDAQTALMGADHPMTMTTRENLATVIYAQGRLVDAEMRYRELLTARLGRLGERSEDTLRNRLLLGVVLHEQERHGEAIAILRDNLEATRSALGADHRDTLSTMRSLGDALVANGDYAEAEKLLRGALEGFRRTLGKDDVESLVTLTSMGVLANARGDVKTSESSLRQALSGLRANREAEGRDTLAAMAALARVLGASGSAVEAEALARELVANARETIDPQNPLMGVYLTLHGKLLIQLRRFEDAQRALDAARTQLTQADTAPLSSVRDLIDGYVVLYESREAAQPGQGMASRAQTWREKRAALRKMAPGSVAQLMAEH